MQDDFIARATELGAQIHVVGSRDEAVAAIVDLFRTSGALKVTVAPDLGEMVGPVSEALDRAGAEFVEGDSAVALASADMGITRAVAGIAETGSIVVAGNENAPRLSTMLPPIHVALLDSSALVSTLDDAGEYLRRISLAPQGERIRYVSFVSGPSRTSDVEKTLTVGVHGPGQLHVLLLP